MGEECSPEAWYEVLQDLGGLKASEISRKAYDEALAAFPTAVRVPFRGSLSTHANWL